MEYVEGETLRQRLATSRLSLREALDIAIQVAAALSAAHAAGIVHRDIKPENVMLRPDGVVKVLDFGLAKLARCRAPTGADTTQLGVNTDAGTVVGTAAYMSPEQARGQQVDARTDIWSLGVLLYEMVAGRSPFAAPSGSDVLAAILQNAACAAGALRAGRPGRTAAHPHEDAAQGSRPAVSDRAGPAARSASAARRRAVARTIRKRARRGDHTGACAQRLRCDRRRRASRAASRGGSRVAAAVHRRWAQCWRVWWWRTARPAQAPAVPPAAPVERTLTRLTFGSGLQTDVTFSPDGRFIAYASDRAGNFDIWVQPVAGRRTRADHEVDRRRIRSPTGRLTASTIVFRPSATAAGCTSCPRSVAPNAGSRREGIGLAFLLMAVP